MTSRPIDLTSSGAVSVTADPIPVDIDEDAIAEATARGTATALQNAITKSGHWHSTGKLQRGLEAARVGPGQYAVTKPIDRIESAGLATRFEREVGELVDETEVDRAIDAALEELLR